MRLVCDEGTTLDVDVETVAPPAGPLTRVPGYVNFQRVPLSVIRWSNLAVTSTDAKTTGWFRDNVVAPAVLSERPLAVVFEYTSLMYLFYLVGDKIHAMVVDWAALSRVAPAPAAVPDKGRVFDRVMDERRNRTRRTPAPPSPEKPSLLAPRQVERTLQKLVLSGLRLRGLPAVDTSATTKELYQMTLKAAEFASRKYATVTVPALQETVEKLLEIFIDT
ncbi:mitochondrial morphogenesis protein Sld7p [Diutina catenulata]